MSWHDFVLNVKVFLFGTKEEFFPLPKASEYRIQEFLSD